MLGIEAWRHPTASHKRPAMFFFFANRVSRQTYFSLPIVSRIPPSQLAVFTFSFRTQISKKRNRCPILPYAFSPRRGCGCGELCQFVQMGDVVDSFRQVRSPLQIRSLWIRLTISVSFDTFHSWLENHRPVDWQLSLVAQESSRSPAYHSMDKCIMSRANRHDTDTLLASHPCRLCCISGLALGIVSASSSAFLVVRFSSPSSAWSVLLHVPRARAPCAHLEGRTSCCLRERDVDGSLSIPFGGTGI